MSKKRIIIGGIALLAVIGIGGGLLFRSRIRAALSMAQSATMNEEAIKAKEEENARTEEEIQQRFNLADLTPDADLSSALQDGSMTLEEAAALLLEQSGVTSEASGSAPEESGIASESAETVGGDQQRPDGSGTETAQSGGASSSAETAQSGGASSGTDTAQSGGTSSNAETQQGGNTSSSAETAQSGGTSSNAETQQEPEQTPQQATQPETQQTAEPEISEEEQRLKNLMAQMVLLRGTFNAKVEDVISSCIAEFMALPEEERTTANKMRIGYSKLDEVATMEEDCDNQVAAIVAQIREIDSNLADQVQQQYENEKALKKASLIAQYT